MELKRLMLTVLVVCLLILNAIPRARAYYSRCGCNPISQDFNQTVESNVDHQCRRCFVFQYAYKENQTWAPYVCVQSIDVSVHHPLLVTVRERFGVVAFQVPETFSKRSFSYDKVCRTLCPLENYFDPMLEPGQQDIFVELTSTSASSINFKLDLSYATSFVVNTDEYVTLNITPSEPKAVQLKMAENLKVVRIEATSYDSKCMLLGVQDLQCPIHDSPSIFQYKGLYHSLTTKSGVHIERQAYGGNLYIVLLMQPTDEACISSFYGEPATSVTAYGSKLVTLKFVPGITGGEVWLAVGVTLLIYVGFCLVSAGVCCYVYKSKDPEEDPEHPQKVPETRVELQSLLDTAKGGSGEGSQNISNTETAQRDRNTVIQMDNTTQTYCDIMVKYVQHASRLKENLNVSDLSTKTDVHIRKRTKLFSWNLVTIGVFFALPVVQLVYINQKIVYYTGNQDICYYNFLCSHQVSYISDFNHLFSNIGYIVLGVLFLLIVRKRESVALEKTHPEETNPNAEKLRGVPNHFGLMYAMGWSLVMEGILSGSYHVCPKKSNFQFDTAFMYVIAALSMLKLYHSRHPDVSMRSHIFWMLVTIPITMGAGELLSDGGDGLWFWIIVMIVHMASLITLCIKIYYMGARKMVSLPPCFDEMGLLNGQIKDEQIYTSSNKSRNTDRRSIRLYRTQKGELSGGWVPKKKDRTPYVEIDFLKTCTLTGFKTQGRDEGDEWVKKFSVSFSKDGSPWFEMKDKEKVKVFPGNFDNSSTVTNYFDTPIYAHHIRIHPITWEKEPGMRLEVLGCKHGCSHSIKTKSDELNGCIKYKDRFKFLLLAVLGNFVWDLYGIISRPAAFVTYLLWLFLGNAVAYLIYYLIMKGLWYKKTACPRRKFNFIALMYGAAAFIFWGFSIIYFESNVTSWEDTPAISREKNLHCCFLSFYDYHDVWHLLSSFALFFSCMFLLTIDDDVKHVPRREIPVF